MSAYGVAAKSDDSEVMEGVTIVRELCCSIAAWSMSCAVWKGRTAKTSRCGCISSWEPRRDCAKRSTATQPGRYRIACTPSPWVASAIAARSPPPITPSPRRSARSIAWRRSPVRSKKPSPSTTGAWSARRRAARKAAGRLRKRRVARRAGWGRAARLACLKALAVRRRQRCAG